MLRFFLFTLSLIFITNAAGAESSVQKEESFKNFLSGIEPGLAFIYRTRSHQRGALIREAPSFIVLPSFKFVDWLTLGQGLTYSQNILNQDLLLKAGFKFIEDSSAFELINDRETFRSSRDLSLELFLELDYTPAEHMIMKLEYSKDVIDHLGAYTAVSFESPIWMRYYELKFGLEVGYGNSRHNIHFYGDGAVTGFAFYNLYSRLTLLNLPFDGMVDVKLESTNIALEQNQAASLVRKGDSPIALSVMATWILY